MTGILGGVVKSMGSSDAGRAQLGKILVDGGKLSPALMRELTAKTVSPVDLSVAKNLANKLAGTPSGFIAKALADGIGEQLKGQGMMRTALETGADLTGGATKEAFQRQNIQNIR